MSSVRATAEFRTGRQATARPSLVLDVVLPVATALTVLWLVLLVLFLPAFLHPALDLAGSAQTLGLSAAETHSLSDRTVRELWLGPGTFSFAGPEGTRFYDEAEAAHLRDVRLVLFAFLAIGAGAAGLVLAGVLQGRDDPRAWRAVARGAGGLVLAVLAVGLFALLAFQVAFELFHRLLFPGGNWAFDAEAQRLVQLYPLAFWQLTAAAFALLTLFGGALLWLLSRRRERSLGGPVSRRARAGGAG